MMKALFSATLLEALLAPAAVTAFITGVFTIGVVVITDILSRRKKGKSGETSHMGKRPADYSQYEDIIRQKDRINKSLEEDYNALKLERNAIRAERDDYYQKWKVSEDTISKLRHAREYLELAAQIKSDK